MISCSSLESHHFRIEFVHHLVEYPGTLKFQNTSGRYIKYEWEDQQCLKMFKDIYIGILRQKKYIKLRTEP